MENTDSLAVTMTQAAQLLNVSRPTIYRLAKTEDFPVVHLGGCTRVLVEDLRVWLKNRSGVKV